jgi:hypothetical protein
MPREKAAMQSCINGQRAVARGMQRGGRQSRAERRAEAFVGQFAALPQVVVVALG